jgi:hypothetical protein
VATFPDDGLLPALNDEDYRWLRPGEDASTGDKMADTIAWVMNIGEANRIVWPAEIDGELTPPPDAHVLEYLVRREFSDTDDPEASAEFQLRPRAVTIGVVDKLPHCFYCERGGRPGVGARYDGPMTREDNSPWAFMCPDCYRAHSTGQLGSGYGQYLLLRSEVRADVIEAHERAREYWSARTGCANR